MNENEEKSQVIAEKVEICVHEWKLKSNRFYTDTIECTKCLKKKEVHLNRLHNPPTTPDFFTPEGQAVLAKALLEFKNRDIGRAFRDCLRKRFFPMDEIEEMLIIEKETKLGQLFYEFLEERKGGKGGREG